MNIKIKKLDDRATIPTVGSPDSAGMDLYCLDKFMLSRGYGRVVPTGIAVEIPQGYVGIVRSRSGLRFKYNIEAFHGTIDADYRGELKVMLNLISDDNEVVKFDAGSRIAQLVVTPILPPEIVVVDELSDTVRGEGGFGHTGV